ncbi:unnamed protein product [Lampetra fluviatilis]
MLESGSMEERDFTCPVCLELFVDPVTLNCGHTFCSACIERHWGTESAARGGFTCPECRQAYPAKPELRKSILVANLVAQMRRPRDHAHLPRCDAEARLYDGGVAVATGSVGVVPCGCCPGGARPAVKSCAHCEMSFCEMHLAPHRQVPHLKAHELVPPIGGLGMRECREHGRRVELFCRSDLQLLCGAACTTLHSQHELVPVHQEHAHRLDQLGSFKETLLTRETWMASYVDGAGRSSDALKLCAEETSSRLLSKYDELLRALSEERDEALRSAGRERDDGLAQVARGLARCEAALGGVRAALAAVARLEGTQGHAAFLAKCTQEWQSIAELVATPVEPPPVPSLSLVTVAPLERRLDEMLATCRASRPTAAASAATTAATAATAATSGTSSPSLRPRGAARPSTATGAAMQQLHHLSSSSSSNSSTITEELNRLIPRHDNPPLRPAPTAPSSSSGPRQPRSFPVAPSTPGKAPPPPSSKLRWQPLPSPRLATAPDEDYVVPLESPDLSLLPLPPPPLLPRVAVGQIQRPRLPVPAKPQQQQPQQPQAQDLQLRLLQKLQQEGVAPAFDVAKPPSRDDLINNYGFSPTLNPNSASPRLQLSRDLRSAKRVAYPQQLAPHAERFDGCPQVLAAESLFSGQRYWEVKVEWARWCTVGVAYGSAPRKGPSDACGLGVSPAVSWCLEKDRGACFSRHNGAKVPGGARANRNLRTVGVFLDWAEGVLAFYDADCMELLHAFQHRFTEPLYPALGINRDDDSVTVLNLGS